MKFFLSAPTDDRGKNRNGYALEAMGYRVVYFDHRKMKKTYGQAGMERALVQKVQVEAPDIFIQIAHGPSPVVFDLVREHSRHVCGWWFDYRTTFPQWIADYAEVMDYFFTVVKSWEEYHPHIAFLPQGFNIFEHPHIETEKTTDLVFIGNAGQRNYRKKVLKALYKRLTPHKINLKVYGYPPFWKDCPFSAGLQVEGAAFSQVVNSARINLGLFPFDQSERPIAYQSNRMHQTIGAGGFFLTYAVEQLDLLYEPGQEIATYQQRDPFDVDDMYERIMYYLGPGAEEREQIREAGYLKALEEHQYSRRFEELLDLLEVDA